MAFTDYSELQTAVAGWLQRSDLTSQIPDFIRLAEAEMDRRLRVSQNMKRADLSASARFTTLPSDLVQIRSVSATVSGNSVDLPFISHDRAMRYTTAGKPEGYTVVGNEIGLVPPPDTTYTLALVYWRTIPPLASSTSNWVLEQYPDLYLYRSVYEGAVYTRDTGLMATMLERYNTVLAEIESLDAQRQFGSTAPAMRVA